MTTLKDQVTSITDTSSVSKFISESASLSHLKSNYPLFNDFVGLLTSFSLINYFLELSTSIFNDFKKVVDSYLPWLSKSVQSLDSFITDLFLVKFIDVYFPVFKQISFKSFTLKNIANYLKSFKLVSTILDSPAVKVINANVQQTFKYINTQLLSIVGDDSLSKNESDEVKKFAKIIGALLVQVGHLPFKYQDHIQTVYSQEISKNNNNHLKAFKSTSNEIVSTISGNLKKNTNLALENLNDLKKSFVNGEAKVKSSNGTTNGTVSSAVDAVENALGSSTVEVNTSNANGEILIGA